MDTCKIILTCDTGDEPQELPLGLVLAFGTGLSHRGGKALAAEFVRVRAVTIRGLSREEAARLVKRVRPFGAQCLIELDNCPTCRSPLTRILSDFRAWLSPQRRELIASGRAILGPDDGKPTPDCVCLLCIPEWRDFHQLAIQLEECERAKEQAIGAQDFDSARALHDRQEGLRPRLETLLQRLRSSAVSGC